jgi:hypothetical protein
VNFRSAVSASFHSHKGRRPYFNAFNFLKRVLPGRPWARVSETAVKN